MKMGGVSTLINVNLIENPMGTEKMAKLIIKTGIPLMLSLLI